VKATNPFSRVYGLNSLVNRAGAFPRPFCSQTFEEVVCFLAKENENMIVWNPKYIFFKAICILLQSSKDQYKIFLADLESQTGQFKALKSYSWFDQNVNFLVSRRFLQLGKMLLTLFNHDRGNLSSVVAVVHASCHLAQEKRAKNFFSVLGSTNEADFKDALTEVIKNQRRNYSDAGSLKLFEDIEGLTLLDFRKMRPLR